MTNFDKDWVWLAHRSDGKMDGGLIETEEEAEKYRKNDDVYFRVEKYHREMPSVVTPSSIVFS